MPAGARFDGLHRGRRGFVLGTGMSVAILLDEMGYRPERLGGEIVVGCKQVHRRFPLSYWVSMDARFYARERAALSGAPFIKFVPAVAGEDHDPTVVPLTGRPGATATTVLPTGLADVPTDGDTGLVAVQIAYVLGLDPIYLLGINDRIHRGRLHFHEESKRPVTDDEVARMGGAMRALVESLGRAGVAVYSCSPISGLNDVVRYVDIRTLPAA